MSVIGRCVVCATTRRLVPAGACPDCLRRFGARFVPLAARVRLDPGFRLLVWKALPAALRAAFLVYFGSTPGPPPIGARGE
jgi:hypothetical protein